MKFYLQIPNKHIFVLAISTVLQLIPASVAVSQEMIPSKISSKLLHLPIGKSHLYSTKELISKVSVADPTIADVMLISPSQIYVLAKKSGTTNVFIWRGSGSVPLNLNVTVGVDVSAVQNLLSNLLPGEKGVRVSSAGDSIVLSGQLSNSSAVQQAVQITQEFVTDKKVMNMMTTEHLPQVLLEVKVAEIDRSLADQLGIQVQGSNFSFNMLNGAAALGFAATASGTIGTTTSWLQAQINSGLVKILAEPNIMAISGQDGEFLAGGIVFLPVPQTSGSGGTVITLQQVNYGVGVKFTPTVLAGGRINLKVSPQVSEVSRQGITVSSGGSTSILPQIITRQASTTVQLYDGQTFAIGGLMKNNVVEVISAFPGLASLPVIGALFRSSSFASDKTELMMTVTPHLVKPTASKPSLPTDNYIQPTQAEFQIEGKLEGGSPPKISPPVSSPTIEVVK